MLDQLNEELIREDKEPIAFDSDCREGICGACGLVINGMAHGPKLGCTTCELRMREFPDGADITVEPFRADALPGHQGPGRRPQRPRPHHRGGRLYLGEHRLRARRQRHPDSQGHRRRSHGRGGVHRLRRLRRRLPQRFGRALYRCENLAPCAPAAGPSRAGAARHPHGGPDGRRRLRLCSNHGECEAACPKGISIVNIARMRREYIRASTSKAGARAVLIGGRAVL